MNFALIIPTHNFKAGISKTFSRIANWRQNNALSCDVYFIDDGSSDGTREALHSLAGTSSGWCTLLSHPVNRGKGAAIRTGFEAAKQKHEYVILMDCDLHYGLDIVADRLLSELVNNDIVIVDRSWTQQTHGSVLRQMASGVFNRMVGILTGVMFKDTQAGLKGFNVRTCAPLFDLARIHGFASDVEILSLSAFYRLRIAQVPISFDYPRRLPEHTTVNLLKAPWVMLYDLIRINVNWKRGFYEHPLLKQQVTAKVYSIQQVEKNATNSGAPLDSRPTAKISPSN